jgi:hypothetical protein
MISTEFAPRVRAFKVRAWLLYLACSLVAVFPRLLSLDMPLERDEGAYACVADSIASGGIPYVETFDHKPPGIHYIYRWSFLVFGRSLAAPRVAAVLAVACACFLLAVLLGRHTGCTSAGIGAAFLLGFGSTAPSMAGPTANTEIFTLPLILVGVLFLSRLKEGPGFQGFAAGLAFGLGAMIKQPIALIGAATAAAAFWPLRLQWRTLLLAGTAFAIGAVLPFGTALGWYIGRGQLGPFWDCIYRYNSDYMGFVPWQRSLLNGWDVLLYVFHSEVILWMLALVGLFVRRRGPIPSLVHWTWLLASFGAVALGRSYYPHYFIFMLPVLAYGAGMVIARLAEARIGAFGTVAAIAGCSVFYHLPLWRIPGPDLSRMIYLNSDLFVRTRELGTFLHQHGRNDTAFVLGSEPELYFYASMRPVTRFIYSYPFSSNARNRSIYRRDLLQDLSCDTPEWLVVQTELFDWSSDQEFLRAVLRPMAQYRLMAVSRDGASDVFVGSAAIEEATRPNIPSKLLVFRRSLPAEASQMTLQLWATQAGLNLGCDGVSVSLGEECEE